MESSTQLAELQKFKVALLREIPGGQTRAGLLKCRLDTGSPGGHEHQVPGSSCPDIMIQQVWGRAWEDAFSNTFPGEAEADAPGLGSHLEDHWAGG